MGTSMFLKEKNPEVKIIGVQPVDGADNSRYQEMVAIVCAEDL